VLGWVNFLATFSQYFYNKLPILQYNLFYNSFVLFHWPILFVTLYVTYIYFTSSHLYIKMFFKSLKRGCFHLQFTQTSIHICLQWLNLTRVTTVYLHVTCNFTWLIYVFCILYNVILHTYLWFIYCKFLFTQL